MMNLSVTGKKVASPNPPKKALEAINPFIIQSKPINQKPQTQIKPKPAVIHAPKGQQKKQQPMKVEPKKEVTVKKEEKVQKKQVPSVKVQEKVEQKTVEPQPIPQPKKQEVISQVTVRYNHYKQDFPSVNGILSFLPIQQKYSFADVFRGKYLPVLKIFRSNDQIIPETTGLAVEYTWKVTEGQQYKLEIREDEDEELKHEKRAYKASDNPNYGLPKKNARFEELTEQMKKLDPSELGSEKHRAMLQQRDLEDVLFS